MLVPGERVPGPVVEGVDVLPEPGVPVQGPVQPVHPCRELSANLVTLGFGCSK